MQRTPNNFSRSWRGMVIALWLVGCCWPMSLVADPFYERLFQDGTLALSRGDHAGAARQLRLACFGLLDSPEPLAVCLARLTVAQSHLDREDDVHDTIGRVLEVERRFQVYAAADLSPAVRRELESTIQESAPPEALDALPAFRHIAELQRRAAATATPEGTAAADATSPEAPELSEPAPEQVAVGSPAVSDGEASSDGPTEIEEGVLAQNRQILVAGARDRFGDAYDSVRSLAERYPRWQDAQLVSAELAYRLSRWDDAVAYFSRADERLAERPELQFYLAVAQYKSGDVEAARNMLDACLPRIATSEYVEYWVERIRASS